MSKPKTKTYVLKVGQHRAGNLKYVQGDKLELTPRAARALVNKVERLDDSASEQALGLFPTQPLQQPPTQPPLPPSGENGGEEPETIEELHVALLKLGVEFDETETEEQLRDKYESATIPD